MSDINKNSTLLNENKSRFVKIANEEYLNRKKESASDFNLTQEEKDWRKEKVDKLKAGVFFTFVTAFGLFSGFGLSLTSTKKRETEELDPKELKSYNQLHNRGVELARRALFRATVYSVSGFTLVCAGIWALSGARTFEEFRFNIGQSLPRISKPKDKEGRTEFSNLTDLFQYIIDEDNKKKTSKSGESSSAK